MAWPKAPPAAKRQAGNSVPIKSRKSPRLLFRDKWPETTGPVADRWVRVWTNSGATNGFCGEFPPAAVLPPHRVPPTPGSPVAEAGWLEPRAAPAGHPPPEPFRFPSAEHPLLAQAVHQSDAGIATTDGPEAGLCWPLERQ